ncbi:hypothetical protein NDU88_001233 [Pleurodeles waltl]|uniref:Uncharacterized protein n=1 Tax=Pleurodeles waltl TaxID=8319 RepID=A0AAV7THR0_PLEWA|nr:hypothetical protein NDU88_001233 [Pleurodeles waltl]
MGAPSWRWFSGGPRVGHWKPGAITREVACHSRQAGRIWFGRDGAPDRRAAPILDCPGEALTFRSQDRGFLLGAERATLRGLGHRTLRSGE